MYIRLPSISETTVLSMLSLGEYSLILQWQIDMYAISLLNTFSVPTLYSQDGKQEVIYKDEGVSANSVTSKTFRVI